MSYRERQRLADIQAAIDAIRSHLQRGNLTDGLIFDAVRIRLLEIGEAVKALPDDLLATQPSIPWRQIARMRDHLAYRYSTPHTPSCRPPSTKTCPTSSAPSRLWIARPLAKTCARAPVLRDLTP
jgi:uncharacterized protein with HEPN domain